MVVLSMLDSSYLCWLQVQFETNAVRECALIDNAEGW